MRIFKSAVALSALAGTAGLLVVAAADPQDAATLSSLRERVFAVPSLIQAAHVGVVLLDVDGEETARLPEETLRETEAFFEKISRGRFKMKFEDAGRQAAGLSHEALSKMKTGSDDEVAFLRSVIRVARAERAANAYLVLTPHRGAVRDFFLWPHAGRLTVAGRTTPFVVTWSDAPVGVHAHELAHLLGLPDDYEHQSEAEGKWCLMSLGYKAGDPAGSAPSTLCAPCRTKLHWMDRVTSSAPQVVFDIDAALELELPEGRVLAEWRDDRFLIWTESRRRVSLKGEVTKDAPLAIAGATLTMTRDGKTPVLEWKKR